MTNPDGATWGPVEIQPLTPGAAIALLHHRHNSGAACAACEIVHLRLETEGIRSALAEERKVCLLCRPQDMGITPGSTLVDLSYVEGYNAALDDFAASIRSRG